MILFAQATPRMRRMIAALFILGFLATCMLAYRDARTGYELRVQNWSGHPIEVYLAQETEKGTRVRYLFDVWNYAISRSYRLKRDETGELVFSPRGTGRRIARVELPNDARKAVRRSEGTLLVKLYPTHHYLSDGAEWRIRSAPRVPPETPLLYIGASGWLFTLARWRNKKRRPA